MYRGGMPWSTDSATLNPWILAAFYADNQRERADDPDEMRETVRNGWYMPPTFGVDTYAHPLKDAFWQKRVVDLERIDIPVLTMGSWDDYFPTGTVAQFQRTASRDKMLVMGFTGHNWPGPDFDHSTLTHRWFDHYLKGRPNGISRQVRTNPVHYYSMCGANIGGAPPETSRCPEHDSRNSGFATGPTSRERRVRSSQVPAITARKPMSINPVKDDTTASTTGDSSPATIARINDRATI